MSRVFDVALLMRLFLFMLPSQLFRKSLILWEEGVHRRVDVAVGTDASELLRNILDHWQTTIVQIWLTQIP